MIVEAIDMCYKEFTSTERKAILTKYKPLVVKHAKAALDKFDKYIPESLEKYRYSQLYQHMQEPIVVRGPTGTFGPQLIHEKLGTVGVFGAPAWLQVHCEYLRILDLHAAACYCARNVQVRH